MHSFIFPFNKYFTEFHNVPLTFLEAGDLVMNRTDEICLRMKFTFQRVLKRTQFKEFPLSRGRQFSGWIFFIAHLTLHAAP